MPNVQEDSMPTTGNPGVVVPIYICDSSTWELYAGGTKIQGNYTGSWRPAQDETQASEHNKMKKIKYFDLHNNETINLIMQTIS